MRLAWKAWVALWDLREAPHSMALIRIALGLCVVYDFATIARLGLVGQLFGDSSAGGWAGYLGRDSPPPWGYLPAMAADGWLIWGLMFAAALCVVLGIFTRTAMVVFVLLSAQAAQILGGADRGIDTIIRNVLLVLACSGAGQVWSVDAWLRTGRWRGDGALVPAWPRHLIICQLVLMYTVAGVSKFGFQWMPWGGHTALYTVLQDPAVAWADWSGAAAQPWYLLTQIGTAVTMIWEWFSPLLLVVFYFRYTRSLTGRLRAVSNRLRMELVWGSVGLVFHVAIAALLQLGIFPWAMLATYFALIHPAELPRWLAPARPSSP